MRAVRVGARRHLGPRPGRTGGRTGRAGGAHHGSARIAGAHGQHPPLTPRRSQLRVLLGGSPAGGAPGRRVRPRGAVPGRGDDGQALRGQRRRVRALHDQLRDRRAGAAGGLPPPLRARGPRGRVARDHDQLQPGQRTLVHRAAGARRRCPAGRVGLRRVRRHRLVRHHRHRGIRRGGRRPRDARTATRLRPGAGGGGARRRAGRGRGRCTGHSPADRLRPHRRARRRRARPRPG